MTSEDEEREIEAAIIGTSDATAADIAGAHQEDVEDAVEDVADAINVQTYVDEVLALRAEMVEMRQLLATVAGLDLLNRSLQHGFEAIGEQLAPLRNLVPPSNVGKLDKDDTPKKIVHLRASLRREDLENLGMLTVAAAPVDYIGAPVSIKSSEGEGR